MRIISPFFDYYDPIAKTLYDKDVIYNRQTISTQKHSFRYVQKLDRSISISFCGYGFLGYSFLMQDGTWSKYMYTPDSIEKFIAIHFHKERDNRRRWGNPYLGHRRRYEERIKNGYDKFSQYTWDKYEAPITANDSNDMIINPRLADYDFQSVKDPYTAFTELYMYIGSQAKKDKDVPVVPDKILAEVKGFDKYSFRKDKSKK